MQDLPGSLDRSPQEVRGLAVAVDDTWEVLASGMQGVLENA